MYLDIILNLETISWWGAMEKRLKIRTILSVYALVLIPLFATGGYEIAETEHSNSANPLDILNDKAKHLPENTFKRKLVKPGKKQNLRKILYLTFDDGPGKGTANVLRALKEENVEATMFFIGKKVEKNKALYTQALAMPHLLIANHTYSHANDAYAKFYSHMATVISDVDRAQRIIGGAKYLRLAGRNVWRLPLYMRNDYGLSKIRRNSESAVYTALSNRGYQIYGWDIEWQFNHSTGKLAYNADRMISRINTLYRSKRLAGAGKMVLLAHDAMFRTQNGLQQLRELIQILKADAWQFETIDRFTKTTPDVIVGNKLSVSPPKVIHLVMKERTSPITQNPTKKRNILKLLRQ